MTPHRTDGVALGLGLIFLSLAVVWLVARLADLDTVRLGWVLTGGLIVFGLAGIAGILIAALRRHADDPDR
jgi:uncharacterized membrane protein